MKLAEARDGYQIHSAKASDVARQLAFAGFGVVWVFKPSDGGIKQIPEALYFAAIFFVLALCCDILQYVCATFTWGVFQRLKECEFLRAGKDKTDEFLAPGWINWPALLFFWGKQVMLGIGYWRFLSWLSEVG